MLFRNLITVKNADLETVLTRILNVRIHLPRDLLERGQMLIKGFA